MSSMDLCQPVLLKRRGGDEKVQRSGEDAWMEHLEFRVRGVTFYVHIMRLMPQGIEHDYQKTVCCRQMNATTHTLLRTDIKERPHYLFSKWAACIS